MPNAREIIAAAQAKQLGVGPLQLARLCCEALGRIGIVERATHPLGRYLFAEESDRRAAYAGIALALLGGDEAERAVMAARDRFGPNSLFWTEVSRYYRRTGGEAKLEAQTAEGHLDRGIARREKGDLDGAIADFSRATEMEPGLAGAWNNRGFARYEKGDLGGGGEGGRSPPQRGRRVRYDRGLTR